MQKILSSFCLMTVVILAMSATTHAQDKVVVIPLGSSPKARGISELNCANHSVPIGIDDNWNVICSDKTVFVSSQTYTGNLGGLTGADAKCNTLASAAGLKGNYMAWLSDSMNSPSTRFNDYEYNNYVLTDGTSIAHAWADLIDSSLLHAINLNENGQATSAQYVWTNTLQDGTIGNVNNLWNCFSWTSSEISYSGGRGTTNSTTATWTNNGAPSCSLNYPIYCFEQ